MVRDEDCRQVRTSVMGTVVGTVRREPCRRGARPWLICPGLAPGRYSLGVGAELSPNVFREADRSHGASRLQRVGFEGNASPGRVRSVTNVWTCRTSTTW